MVFCVSSAAAKSFIQPLISKLAETKKNVSTLDYWNLFWLSVTKLLIQKDFLFLLLFFHVLSMMLILYQIEQTNLKIEIYIYAYEN